MSAAAAIDTRSEAWRHQCEVRQVLRWRNEHGREWVHEHLAGIAKKRGQPAADRLLADCIDQFGKGNSGSAGVWLS